MIKSLFKKEVYSDTEVVERLQHSDRRVEEWFYNTTRRYFNEHFNEVFFDKDKKQEIFQMAFLKLWTEIENRKIRMVNGAISRQQKNGGYKPMSCSLTTFLMTFAKLENREIMRRVKDVYVDDLIACEAVSSEYATLSQNDTEEEKEQLIRIMDDCIQGLPPHCIEIITMFYLEGKNLDEIITLRKEGNITKTGLKSAKSKCMTTLKERVRAEMARYEICC